MEDHVISPVFETSAVALSAQDPAACTIISHNYLAQSSILAESYLAHHPSGRFYLLVVDGLPPGVELNPGIVLIHPDDLGLPYFREMCFKYDAMELCTALKPTLLSLLLDAKAEQQIIYLDPDIMVMRRLSELLSALAHDDLVLVPHLLHPLPLDGFHPSEQDVLLSGTYNLGFVAVRNSAIVRQFLEWWAYRLRDHCRNDQPHGIFVDQRWVDLVPSLFRPTLIFDDETYDVAYWNLPARPLARLGDVFCIAERPIAFFHFSGFDPNQPLTLSKHQNRITVTAESALGQLLAEYTVLLEQHGYQVASGRGYGYSRFDNGIEVNPLLRGLYSELEESDRERFGDPFATAGPNSFFSWAMSPAAGQELSPFEHAQEKRELRDPNNVAARLADQAARILQRDTRIAELDGLLAERDARLGELSVHVAERDMRIAELDAHVAEVGAQIARQDEYVRQIWSSRFYRVWQRLSPAYKALRAADSVLRHKDIREVRRRSRWTRAWLFSVIRTIQRSFTT